MIDNILLGKVKWKFHMIKYKFLRSKRISKRFSVTKVKNDLNKTIYKKKNVGSNQYKLT